jgi:hypothetical protein
LQILIANTHLYDHPGAIIAFPDDIFGLSRLASSGNVYGAVSRVMTAQEIGKSADKVKTAQQMESYHGSRPNH